MKKIFCFSILSILTSFLSAQNNDYNIWQLMPHQYSNGNYSGQQMMSYVIQTNGDSAKTIVIDGGLGGPLFQDDATYLKNFLGIIGREHVDAWFITHSDEDHLLALTNILNTPGNITIDTIYYSFPCADDITDQSKKAAYLDICDRAGISDCEECWLYVQDQHDGDVLMQSYRPYKLALQNTSLNVATHSLNTDEDYYFDNIRIHILKVCNPNLDWYPYNEGRNDQSVVFKILGQNPDTLKTILFLGDLGRRGGTELIDSEQDIVADYVQMAHHGMHAILPDNPSFYNEVSPKYALWPSPKSVYYYVNEKNVNDKSDKDAINDAGVLHNYVSGIEGLVLIPGCLSNLPSSINIPDVTYTFDATTPNLIMGNHISNSGNVLINGDASLYLISTNEIDINADSGTFVATYQSTFRAQIVPECNPSLELMQSQKKKLTISIPKDDRINIYPNPVDESIQIKFNLKNDALNNVTLFSVRGDKLRETGWFNMREGIKTMNLNDISGGIYILKIYTGGEIITKKIIVK